MKLKEQNELMCELFDRGKSEGNIFRKDALKSLGWFSLACYGLYKAMSKSLDCGEHYGRSQENYKLVGEFAEMTAEDEDMTS